jgi:mono/diheme cytochrome c family protein
MGRFSRRWALLMIVLTLAFSLGVAACGDDDEPDTDTAGEVVGDAADQVEDAADDAADALNVVAGDPDAGAGVFTEQGCAGCHSVDSDAVMTGPSLQNIGTVAEERTDQSAAEYLRESITHPNAFVVEGYQEGVMPAYELPDDQLDNLVAYLLTLRQ